MQTGLLLALLGIPDNASTSEESFLEKFALSEEKTRSELLEASNLGLVVLSRGYLNVPRPARMQLATRCIQYGVDIERVCRAAGWREFEDLAALILECNDYRTTKHLRFKHEGKGYEVDVLALKKPWSLVVECKRWRRSRRPSALRRAAGIQRRKTSILGGLLSNSDTRLDIHPSLPAKLVPVVITLSETSLEIEDGVPIVPVGKFQDFLNEYAGYTDDLAVFRSSSNAL